MSESELSRRRCRGSSPPALTSLPDDDDMMREILLRLPPQPSSLPRASAVCRRWRGLATDRKFIARFRAHHRKPPLLGVFEQDDHIVFTPVLDPPDRIPPRRFDLRIRDGRSSVGAELLGCRHGRVLVIQKVREEVVVCNPITGEQRRLPIPPGLDILVLRGAVVCAAGDQGHVHGDCHSNPFKVVLVSMATSDGPSFACVYSSETGMWGDLVSAELPISELLSVWGTPGPGAGTLIGNVLYWTFNPAIQYTPRNKIQYILEFDLDRQSLDLTKGPPHKYSSRHQIIQAEDGAVGVAILCWRSIEMWQRKVNSQGVTTWLLWKIVETNDIPGFPAELSRGSFWNFRGYDEDAHAIYFYLAFSVYMLQLNSLHLKKLHETDAKHCHPFTSFYTPGTTITGAAGAEMLHDKLDDCLV